MATFPESSQLQQVIQQVYCATVARSYLFRVFSYICIEFLLRTGTGKTTTVNLAKIFFWLARIGKSCGIRSCLSMRRVNIRTETQPGKVRSLQCFSYNVVRSLSVPEELGHVHNSYNR